MIVTPIPLKIYDIHKDGKVIENPVITPNHYQLHQKKAIRNLTFMKFAIYNKGGKQSKAETTSPAKQSWTPSASKHKKSKSDFNPEKDFDSLPLGNKFNTRKHLRNYSHFVRNDKESAKLGELYNGFPERKIKKSKDPRWYSYCTHIIESEESKGCKHVCKK